ncbi:Histone-lysine N-methyltransferase PRDM9 [Araneus ventricosus]|uniref:Histone-lysine N-methyltransferase PRDM9 n=1 Tax=Araneus ventricosus TaxID=182803 RepID=A0A4Y2PEC7_ARAVE|nr:Histone-lysine N-methyltransferase PRDM9 [Araneus ventricosus]
MTPERAQHTPALSFLSVGISNIPRAGLGVWSEIPLTPGMVFGPYEGAIVRKGAEAEKSGYAWQVRKGSKAHHYIEAKSKGSSNWMRYVNCADRKEFQNVAAFQFQGDIYYKTVKPVLPYTEILVWYGDEYASALGVDVKEKRNTESPRPIEGFGCDVCSAFLSSSEALERHRSQHPYMQPDLLHRCPRCSYSTNFQHSLINHLLMHSGDKPHACPHCSKKFTTRQNLRSHLLLHTGQKEFICSTCGKGFAQMGNLRTHERVHSGERPYRCSHCGKDFTQLGSLERHRKLHTRQKPYPCPHCEYRFNDSTNLRRHITSKHTKVFPHLCPCCGKGFTRQRELKNHVVKHHHSEPAELYVPDHDVKHHHSEPAELCVPDHAVKHHHSGDTEICVPDHADIHHHQKPAEAILAESR